MKRIFLLLGMGMISLVAAAQVDYATYDIIDYSAIERDARERQAFEMQKQQMYWNQMNTERQQALQYQALKAAQEQQAAAEAKQAAAEAEQRKNIVGVYIDDNGEPVQVRLHLSTDPATTKYLVVDGYSKKGSSLLKKCHEMAIEINKQTDGDLVEYFNYKIIVDGRNIYF